MALGTQIPAGAWMAKRSEFGVWLEQARKKAGFPTQAALARRINVEPPTLNKWIQGTRIPDRANALALAEALQVSSLEVFKRLGWAGVLPEAERYFWEDRLSRLSSDGRRRLQSILDALLRDEQGDRTDG